MKKFFMPNYDDSFALQEISILKKRHQSISDKNIFSITYTRDGKPMTDTVGRRNAENHELIIAILETTTWFYTITLNEKTKQTSSLMLSKNKVRVNYFDD